MKLDQLKYNSEMQLSEFILRNFICENFEIFLSLLHFYFVLFALYPPLHKPVINAANCSHFILEWNTGWELVTYTYIWFIYYSYKYTTYVYTIFRYM